MELEVKHTADGSVTLLNKVVNATYHSMHGAVRESLFIYIERGLHYARQHFGNQLNIFEIGFGTGLNAWLTLLEAVKNDLSVHYTSIEKYPVPKDMFKQLNYAQRASATEQVAYKNILESVWEEEVRINANFSLLKQVADVNEIVFPKNIHMVYYDAFGPDDSPESWNATIFEKLYSALPMGAALVTFCAKGNIKRLLKQSGFVVEALPGPPGKRQITRAIKH